ncbi:MAG: hypothetical protein ACOQNV_00025 [Mycoplasmoidaceae bacterium]
MGKKIDQEYVKELAHSLFFEFDDEQLQKIIKEIQELDDELQKTDFQKLVGSYTPVNYTRVTNCAKLRRDDQPDKKYDKDYLSNAKKADKYVVGK